MKFKGVLPSSDCAFLFCPWWELQCFLKTSKGFILIFEKLRNSFHGKIFLFWKNFSPKYPLLFPKWIFLLINNSGADFFSV